MVEDNSRKRLGRGLAALIGDVDTTGRPQPEFRADRKAPIEQIVPNAQNPRRHFDESELTDLANSIREHGIVQPILVRTAKASAAPAKYEIIAGERRWRAAQLAGLHDVPVVIREVEDRQALELAIIENIQRADLNPLEEARGYQQLIEGYQYSQADLGNVIGKSRSHVANTLRLLKLPEAVQALLNTGELSAGHARALVTVEEPEMLARRIVSEGLSVRQTEALAQETIHEKKAGETKPQRAPETKSADVRALERRLEEALGLKVSVSWKPDGTGDVRIAYRTLEQLDAISRKLEGN